jgi:demethylmenaquinone methyltransferase/2-methoxy-6-polyprenyl-1,4-benzoquinol methylase
MSQKKGNPFRSLWGGANYDRFCRLAGFTNTFYERAAAAIPLRPGMRVLDLGCGTASFGMAAVERISPGGRIEGVDLSAQQLAHAGRKVERAGAPVGLERCSMDELPFRPAVFDAVVGCMAFHEVPTVVRVGAVREAARVLRPGGHFALVDWSRPRWGPVSFLSLPIFWWDSYGRGNWFNSHSRGNWRDNWSNVYPDMCRREDLRLLTDVYLSSLVRCQVFEKA